MGVVEALVHTFDISQGLEVPYELTLPKQGQL
jgi:hypothetical protein